MAEIWTGTFAFNTFFIDLDIKSRGRVVEISVKDYGVGIPENDLAKLFRPFYRATNSQIAQVTGIGLFITSEIVKKHGGSVRIESKLGEGTVFYLELPLAK